VTAAALEDVHQIVSAHRGELERAGRTQQIVPMASDQVGIDAVTSDAVQRPVVGGRIEAVEARVAQIRQAWAEAIAEQHEQAKHDVRIRC
jgi:hypothetical protein